MAAPKGPVTPLGHAGPGYYQTEPQHGAVGGSRLRGRKSGREAPRDHIKQPAWEDTLQRHDLLPINDSQVGSNRDFNPNQGQLFNPEEITPRDRRSDVDIARSVGAPTGEIATAKSKRDPVLGATPGFMPGLDTPKQKIAAINNIGQARGVTGASRGGAPFAEMMEDRRSAAGPNAPWYMGTDSSGQHRRDIPGDAAVKVNEAAGRTGTSYSNMARNVAMTSPQMGWKSEGTTDDPTAHQTERMGSTAGMFPNLAVAEDVTRTTTRSMKRGTNLTEDLQARQYVSPEDRASEMSSNKSMVTHPSALGGTTHGREKAALNRVREIDNPGSGMPPYPIQDVKSQKAANFDASLNLSHSNPAVQRIAAQSYTVDRHDAAAVGIDVESNEFKRRGSYEAVAMTGRRAALKNRQLPPNEQAMEWETHRASKGLGRGNQMFTAASGDKPVVRPELAAPPNEPGTKSRGLTRSRVGGIVPDDLTPF